MKKPMIYDCDLHGHTNRSDGNDSPLEFIHRAAERGVKVAAITDHDVVPPTTVQVAGEVWDIIDYAKSCGVNLLLGVEISCETDIEDVHLVCFGCQWESEFFEELNQLTIESKTGSYKVLVERLSEQGMELSWGEILDNHGDPIEETAIQKKMIFNMMAEKGYVKDWSAGKLLVKDLGVKRKKPEAVGVIRRIKEQGGTVILAHPYLIPAAVKYRGRFISRSTFIERLIEAGLDGIEARYTYDKTSYDGSQTKAEIYQEVMERYKDRIPIISAGSDYHADQKKGVVNARDIGECGLMMAEFQANPLLMELLKANETR